MLDGMYVTKSISTGLYPNLDLWTANKLQLQLQQVVNIVSTGLRLWTYYAESCLNKLNVTFRKYPPLKTCSFNMLVSVCNIEKRAQYLLHQAAQLGNYLVSQEQNRYYCSYYCCYCHYHSSFGYFYLGFHWIYFLIWDYNMGFADNLGIQY